MSVLGVSSYFLWSQKGTTVLPLVRGSGFLVSFAHSQTFYHHHVLSAAHVACPVRYRSLYGNTIGLKAIGERHVSTRMLAPDPVTGAVRHAVDLQFRQHFLPNVDVVSLRCTDESNSLPTELTPFELDESGLIEEGTELILCGMEAVEERANPNDDGLTLVKREIDAVCKAALVSPDYGTVCLTTLETATADGRTIELPLSMCGGPVLRKSSRKCVGVIVARAVFAAPPRDTHLGSLYQDPYLDLSAHGMLADAAIKAAFVPVAEFRQPLRRTEL